MDSPDHQRRAIEAYMASQSGPNFEIEHVEKIAQEYVLGREYDVWDAHTNEGRWWVITNPTNLYRQDAIRSMDIALSFHVGLMARVMERQSESLQQPGPSQLMDVLRRLDVASSSLDRAKETEDFQAVGMRLREALVTLAGSLAGLDIYPDDLADKPKLADFKGWASLALTFLASGSNGEKLRPLVVTASHSAWTYVNHLTHARRASKSEARVAMAATSNVIELFGISIARWRQGETTRCPVCMSQRVIVSYEGLNSFEICEACGWTESIDDLPGESSSRDESEERKASREAEGDCIPIEDFGIYISPREAQSIMSAAADMLDEDQHEWVNPYAFEVGDGEFVDAHRAAILVGGNLVPGGAELIYECHQDGCVNPKHVTDGLLPSLDGWRLGVIDSTAVGSDGPVVRVTTDTDSFKLVLSEETLDALGLGDASSLLERVIAVSAVESASTVHFVLAARRFDYSSASVARARVLREAF